MGSTYYIFVSYSTATSQYIIGAYFSVIIFEIKFISHLQISSNHLLISHR